MINIIISLDLSNRYLNKSRKISKMSYLVKSYDIINLKGESLMKIKINKIFGQYNNEINFDNKINIFIGENGIGKSTTISILKCLLEFRYIKLQDYYFESIEIINDNDTVTIKYSDLCLTNDYIYENYKIQYNSEEPSDMLMEFLNELDYRKLYKLNKDFRLLNNKRDLRYFVNDGFNDGFLSYIEPIIKNIYFH